MNPIIESLIDEFGPSTILRILSPFLSDQRKTRIEFVLEQRLLQLRVALENPADIHNALAVVRSAEAFGIPSVDIIHSGPQSSGKRSAMGAQKWTHVSYQESFASFEHSLKKTYLLVGASCGAKNTIEEIPLERPACVIFGNEHAGLSQEALSRCDFTFSLPLFGFSSSLNLSVAAGIVLYTLSSKMRRKGFKEEKGGEKEKEKARFFIQSLGTSLTKKILERALSR